MKKHLICLLFILTALTASRAADEQVPVDQNDKKEPISLETFIQRAARNDTEFEAILLEELKLKYTETLALPQEDIILSVRQDYEVYVGDDREEPATSVELSKLFAETGTEISASYSVSNSFSSGTPTGRIDVALSQSIARNAFGRSTRLLKKITGLENDIARHQVIEAYEDYLAGIISTYYNWRQEWHDLETARSSYNENLKLLDNIKQRRESKIAREIDVNKVTLQVLGKKERLIQQEEQYNQTLTTIRRILRCSSDREVVPTAKQEPAYADMDFDSKFNSFVNESRTFRILDLLENRSSLEVKRDVDDLLPSIDLVAGYETSGDDYELEDNDDMVYVGLQMEWPFTSETDRAQLKTSRIELRQVKLARENALYRLKDGIKSLFFELQKEKRLARVADEKIKLAEAILKDESENYSFGKVTLNDYIQAVNTLDTQRYNQIQHETRYLKLMTEWNRLTDTLVTRRDIEEMHNTREN